MAEIEQIAEEVSTLLCPRGSLLQWQRSRPWLFTKKLGDKFKLIIISKRVILKLIQGLDVHKSCRKYPELSFLDRGDGARDKDEEISRSAAAGADDTDSMGNTSWCGNARERVKKSVGSSSSARRVFYFILLYLFSCWTLGRHSPSCWGYMTFLSL